MAVYAFRQQDFNDDSLVQFAKETKIFGIGGKGLRNEQIPSFHGYYCTYLRVGGITALRALSSHQSLVPPLAAWPLVYTVMTAPVHVQCLSCCLGNL